MVDIGKLVYRLNRLCTQLDNDYYINEGGCCYVAYVIAKLMNRYNINDYYLSIVNTEPKEQLFVLDNIKRRKKKDDEDHLIIKDGTCNHYFITINNKKINGCGYFWKSPKLFRMNISINPNDILWIYHNGNWCDTYDKRNNLAVYNRIEYIFKQCQKQ